MKLNACVGLPSAAYALILLAISPLAVNAALIAQESFTYADGPVESLSGGTGWSGAWGAPLGDVTPPTALFQISGNKAVFNGNNAGQFVNTQQRSLVAPVVASATSAITFEFDLIIGEPDIAAGRGIGVNFMSGANVAFTVGKRINAGVAVWNNGLAATSTMLGTEIIPTGTAGTHHVVAKLTSDGVSSFLAVTNLTNANVSNYTFANVLASISAVQISGYHQSTTANGIDSLSIDVANVPEPSAWLLGVAALAAILAVARRASPRAG